MTSLTNPTLSIRLLALRWRVAARFAGWAVDNTEDIFPGCSMKCQTIAIDLRWFFIGCRLKESSNNMEKVSKKSLWIIGGTLSLVLGMLGLILPILPTTPFLLLAAYCYGRGSDRFLHWLMDRSWVGGYIRSYREGRGIPLKQKVLTILLLWLTIGFTIWSTGMIWWLKVVLCVVAAGVTLHLIKIKTWRPEPPVLIEFVSSIEPVETEP